MYPVIIKKTDYLTIKSVMANLPQHQKSREVGELLAELEKAQIVHDDNIAFDIIQLNSYVEVEETGSSKKICLTLTLPRSANIAEKRLSVLSPLGVALIGFREGMHIEWKLPGGIKKINILRVKQPDSTKH